MTSPKKPSKLSSSEKQAVLRSAATKDLLSFSQVLDYRYTVSWHHEVIARALETARAKIERGEKARIILEVPPRHGKSELATIKFPAQTLGIHPDWPIIVSSYSSELAEDFGLKTRDIIQDERYHAIFSTTLRQDTQARGRWLTEGAGGYTATGVGGAITGRGFKIGIIDDPFKNREEADSEVIREKVWNWYTSTFYTRQEGVSAIIVICTRWHLDDLVGRLLQAQKDAEAEGLAEYDNWEVIRFPAIAEAEEFHRKQGDPLWPEKFPLSVLENIRNTIGIYDWSSLYQQAPILTENVEFKPEHVQHITDEEVKKLDTLCYITIDSAVSKKETADYTGVTINRVSSENKWYIYSYRLKVDTKELIDHIFSLHKTYQPQTIALEETTFTLAIKPFLEEEMRKRNRFFNIEPLKHRQTQKELRIRGLLPRWNTDSIYFVGPNMELQNEMFTFPMGQHDDILDSLAYQTHIAQKPYSSDDGLHYMAKKEQTVNRAR
jgi:hypothetical protein